MKCLVILSLLFSTQLFCQDSLKIRFIDSLISDGEKQVARIVTDKVLRTRLIVLHGGPDTSLAIYKYSLDNDVIEYSQVWIGEKDTGQITSYFFYKDNMIKVLTRTPYSGWQQFAYFDKETLIYAGDSEGHDNPNVNSYLHNYKSVLQKAKRKSKLW